MGGETATDSSPTTLFWIIAAAINPLAKAYCETLVALQHRDIALSQQTSRIEALVANLLLMIDIQHGDDNQIMVRADQMDDTVFEFELWSVTVDAVLVHVKDRGTWVKDLYLSLDKNDQLDLLREIALYALHLVSGLSIVQAEHDFRNNAAAKLAPPVFPQQLIKMRTSKFIEDVLDPRREMLMAAWGQEWVDRIEDEHRALVAMCRSSASLQASINGHTHQTMFNDAWGDLLAKPFVHLRSFCGGLATSFANTTSVESDLSILKCENDLFRQSLTALSVEGIFQTKQLGTIREMLGLITPPDGEEEEEDE